MQNKKLLIIKCARKLFTEKGYYQTTLLDIALESGISIGNLYYYFPSKLEILFEVMDGLILEVEDFIQDFSKLTGSNNKFNFLKKQLSELIRINKLKKEPYLSLVVEIWHISPKLRKSIEKVISSLRFLVQQLLAKYEDLNISDRASINLLASIQGLLFLNFIFNDRLCIGEQLELLRKQYIVNNIS